MWRERNDGGGGVMGSGSGVEGQVGGDELGKGVNGEGSGRKTIPTCHHSLRQQKCLWI